MYFDYCKNKTNSENLMNESTESQAFFKVPTLVLAAGSYKAKVVGFASSSFTARNALSCSGPHIQSLLVLRRSRKGLESSASC